MIRPPQTPKVLGLQAGATMPSQSSPLFKQKKNTAFLIIKSQKIQSPGPEVSFLVLITYVYDSD